MPGPVSTRLLLALHLATYRTILSRNFYSFQRERLVSLEMAAPVKDGAIDGPTTLKLGNKASEDVLSELVHGVKRRLPRAVTPDGKLA